MKTNPLALDSYIRAWETWNMIGITSTQWDDLDESDRLRWIKAIDSVAPAAKEDGIPGEIRPAYIDCCRGSAPAHECYINCGGTKPNPTRDRYFAPHKVMREFLSVCESECNHPYCWSQKPVASLQEPEGDKCKCGHVHYRGGVECLHGTCSCKKFVLDDPCCRTPHCGGECTCEICAPELAERDRLHERVAELETTCAYQDAELRKLRSQETPQEAWIPVEQELPQAGLEVLTMMHGYTGNPLIKQDHTTKYAGNWSPIHPCWKNDGMWFMNDREGRTTHWRNTFASPLPYQEEQETR